MKEEHWLPVVGYEGLYEVSSLGRVRSIITEKILKPGRCGKKGSRNYKYLHVVLYDKNKSKHNYKVHRLVAIAFIPNPLNLPQVNHKDENPENNCVDNLEWCTNKYNCNYGTRNERQGKGHINHPSRSKKVICVETGVIYPSAAEVSRQFKCCESHIISICKGKNDGMDIHGIHLLHVKDTTGDMLTNHSFCRLRFPRRTRQS